MLSADLGDPLVGWIERERIRPFLALTTMASVRHEIRTSEVLSPTHRTVLEARYERVARDIKGGRRDQVTAAVFDMKSAEILSEILPIPVGADALSDMDLVPAALAIQHNYQLVVTDDLEVWADLAAEIPAEIGHLDLLAHSTGSV